MTRMKNLLAVLVLAAIVVTTPAASATTVEVSFVGSATAWQSFALGLYNRLGGTKFHWTSQSNQANVVDSRVIGLTSLGTAWVIYTCSTATCSTVSDVWIYVKMEAPDRCFFAVPTCTIAFTAAELAVPGNQINHFLFSDGSSDANTLPPSLQALLESGIQVGALATELRPEDAMFAMCRANTTIGAGAIGTVDLLDGLGYNLNNKVQGACLTYGNTTLANSVGAPVASGLPGENITTDVANIAVFNVVAGQADPVTGSAIPPWTAMNVGAAPVVFVAAADTANNQLLNVSNVDAVQLQQLFSGTNCDATALGITGGKGLNMFLQEPLSGAMNVVEASLFRGPDVNQFPPVTYSTPLGISQETGVFPNDPLAGQAGTCNSASGTRQRFRVIGPSEAVLGVRNSNFASACTLPGNACLPNAQDGISYLFFSYRDVTGNLLNVNNTIADNGPTGSTHQYKYLTIDGIDPIWNRYNPTKLYGYDPGQNATPGVIPGNLDLTGIAGCTAATGLPCAENQIWGGGLSFPGVRSGAYPAWSMIRAYARTTGGQLSVVKTVVTDAQLSVVATVPDYIPYAPTVCAPPTCAVKVDDPGLLILRAHYLQYDGSGVPINTGVVQNLTKTAVVETGGDMGGETFKCPTTQATCPNNAASPTTPSYTPQSQQVVQGANAAGFVVRP